MNTSKNETALGQMWVFLLIYLAIDVVHFYKKRGPEIRASCYERLA